MPDPTDAGTEPPVATLLGSAAAGWPVPGCRCRSCLSTGRPADHPAVRELGLRVGDLVIGRAGDGTGSVRVGAERAVPVVVGSAVEHDGVRLIGLPGAGGSTLAVVGSGAGTVLWAPVGGLLPAATLDALAEADLDAAALALPGGAGTTGGTGTGGAPVDAAELGRTLAALRRVGAVQPGCDLVAIGLHHGADPGRYGPVLAGWGVRIAPDGAPLGRGHAAADGAAPARTLVLGAAASGKSAHAESLLVADAEVDYLPTGPAPGPDDADWAARVHRHVERRPPWWRTLEGIDLVTALDTPGPALLVDSIGSWVAAALGRSGAWDDADGWRQRYETEADTVVDGWRQARRRVVAVAEETGWGVVPATRSGGVFRDAVGRLNARLATETERVVLVVAGRPVDLDPSRGGAW